jgi:outer membrane receptor for ferrienterochelin and colicins
MAQRIVRVLLLSLLVILGPEFLPAQDAPGQPNLMDMGLEDLMKVEVDSVYGASGYKQSVNDAPASITIITADEIKRYGYRTLADVLRNVPGFYVTSDREFSYVGVRGFGPPGDYNSRVLLLIDGHWANHNVNGGAVFGTELPFDIDLVERVEVIRGPNSSIYIANALLAIINVVTKRGHDEKGLSVSQEMGSHRTYKSNLAYGGQFKNGLDVLFSGSYYFSHGPSQLYFKEFDSPATNHGIAENADGGRFDQLFTKLSYHDFTFVGSYGPAEQTDPTASWGAIFNDPEERVRLSLGFLDLSYEHRFGDDWGYVGRVFYDNDWVHASYPFDESPMGGPAHVLNQLFDYGEDVGASFDVSKRLFRGQTVIAGAEYRDNFKQNQWDYQSQPYISFLDSRRQSSLWGVHAQDEIPIRGDLTLDLGLSYDHYSTFGGDTSPRAGLIYQPREGTSLKVLYGQSFRAPTAFELYYSDPTSGANPNLGPETAKTSELVWEQSLEKNFRLVVSGYYYPIRGVITAESDPASGLVVYENYGRVDLRGSEVTLKRQSRSGWEAGMSLSLEYAKDLEAPGPLTNSPHVLAQANLSVPLFGKKVYASMDAQYVSKRRTEAGDYAGSYWLPNFTLYSKKVLSGWEASASLDNAFNRIYGDPASVAHLEDIILQNGRNFRLKFTYHF